MVLQNCPTYLRCSDQIAITGCSKDAVSVIIPPKIDELPVTVIEAKAFRDTASLKSVTIPESITSIGSAAFYLSVLNELYLPCSVTSIGRNAFGGCRSLKIVTIDAQLTELPDYCFS